MGKGKKEKLDRSSIDGFCGFIGFVVAVVAMGRAAAAHTGVHAGHEQGHILIAFSDSSPQAPGLFIQGLRDSGIHLANRGSLAIKSLCLFCAHG